MNRAQKHQLETLLRQQGQEETPAFSLPLHQRVMEALRVQGLPQAAPRVIETRSWGNVAWRIGLPLAAAAAIAIVGWIVLHPAPPAPQGGRIVKKIERTPSPLEIPKVETPTLAGTNAIEDAKFACLDRDARKLWMFVASQIPELPEEKKDR